MEVTVVTDPELGWDCVIGVLEGNISKKDAREILDIGEDQRIVVHHQRVH